MGVGVEGGGEGVEEEVEEEGVEEEMGWRRRLYEIGRGIKKITTYLKPFGSGALKKAMDNKFGQLI